MPLLEIKGLTVDFLAAGTSLRAVDGVSLTIDAGETLCLVGESGCGKSVTALSIARLVPTPPARYAGGEILLNGRDVLAMKPAELRRIRGGVVSYVFQEPSASLNPVFRVGSQIQEALKLHKPESLRASHTSSLPMHLGTTEGPLTPSLSPSAGERVASGRVRGYCARDLFGFLDRTSDKEIIRLLKLVKIPAPESRLRDYPWQLSGGMQQRVMIAMALASEPKLLVADEPTTALDVTIQAQIIELLRDLKQRLGMAILLITHNLGIVGDMADRVAVMYAGQIVELAPAAELLRRPLHPYTQALINSVPKLSREIRRCEAPDEPAREDARPTKRLTAIPGTVPRIGDFPPGCRFAPRCPIAKPECSKAIPELAEIEPKRWVRCPFWE